MAKEVREVENISDQQKGDTVFFNMLSLGSCSMRTFSATMAKLSLRAKKPETGPVWWYLKQKSAVFIHGY